MADQRKNFFATPWKDRGRVRSERKKGVTIGLRPPRGSYVCAVGQICIVHTEGNFNLETQNQKSRKGFEAQ